ncbi:hypothetical protein B0H13DRAFT_2527791 [Mycena leptocephala]|nr:hypothetical protein B0H13DRAFT_2527791 [Mycena leptocephala]
MNVEGIEWVLAKALIFPSPRYGATKESISASMREADNCAPYPTLSLFQPLAVAANAAADEKSSHMRLMSSIPVLGGAIEAGSWRTGPVRARAEEATIEGGGEEGAWLRRREAGWWWSGARGILNSDSRGRRRQLSAHPSTNELIPTHLGRLGHTWAYGLFTGYQGRAPPAHAAAITLPRRTRVSTYTVDNIARSAAFPAIGRLLGCYRTTTCAYSPTHECPAPTSLPSPEPASTSPCLACGHARRYTPLLPPTHLSLLLAIPIYLPAR